MLLLVWQTVPVSWFSAQTVEPVQHPAQPEVGIVGALLVVEEAVKSVRPSEVEEAPTCPRQGAMLVPLEGEALLSVPAVHH